MKILNQAKEWNEHYKNLNNLMFWPSDSFIRSMNFLKKKLPLKNLKILDYGCGNGRNSFFFDFDKDFIKKKFNYFGFDISKKAIDIARSQKKNNKFFFDTKLVIQKYDLILCIAVLDQLLSYQRKKLLEEIYSLMDKKSCLVLDVLTKNKFIDLQGLGKRVEKDTYILNNNIEKGIYQYFFNNRELKALNKKFNFIYEESLQVKNHVHDRLNKYYTRKILILKKNDKN